MSGPSLYDILGVERGADKEAIKKAYRKKSLVTHPDRPGGDAEEFKKVQKAYEVLMDDHRRMVYDQTGRADDEGGGPGPGGGMPFPFPGMGGGGMPFPFPFDIGSMFGPGVPGPRGAVKRPKAPPKIHELGMTLADFYHGKRVKMQFERHRFCESCKGDGCERVETCGACGGRGQVQRTVMMGPMQMMTNGPCPECMGAGRRGVGQCSGCKGSKFTTQQKSLEMVIEPGMKPGERIVFPKECSDQAEYAEAGDLHVVLLEADEESELERRGDDLSVPVRLGLREALLGCKRTVQGHPGYPEGLEVSVGAGAMHGDTIVIAGEGMPRRGAGGGHGNLLVQVQVVVTEEERAKLVLSSAEIEKLFAT